MGAWVVVLGRKAGRQQLGCLRAKWQAAYELLVSYRTLANGSFVEGRRGRVVSTCGGDDHGLAGVSGAVSARAVGVAAGATTSKVLKS